MTQDYFDKVTQIVINKLEGGYFHPDMRTKNPAKFGSYHRSGETMFGLDRHAGHSLYYSTPRKADGVIDNLKYIYNGSYKYKSQDAKDFWTTIDNANARKNWSWNYNGGSQEGKLKTLASRILYPRYEYLANKYLLPDAKKLVESDPRILFHFIYAIWNGPGWFKKFAEKFNQAVLQGVKNRDSLLEVALNSRINSGNSLIKSGGLKIKGFINNLELPSSQVVSVSSTNKNLNGILLGVMFIAGYVLYKKYYKKL